MPLNPAPTIQTDLALCRVLLTHSISTRSSEVTFAVENGDTATAQDVADDVMLAFNTRLAATLDNEVVIGPTFVLLGDGTNVPAIATSSLALINGAENYNPSQPPNVACLVKKSTAVGGRKNRGRMFFPWMLASADVNEGGTIDGGKVAYLQNLFTLFLSDLVAGNVPMTIANRTFNQPNPPHHVTAITATHNVTTLLVENLVATQRRRLGR